MFSSVLLDAKKLTQIPYADKPLPQLKSDESITYLTPADFQQKFNIQYSESLHGNMADIADTLENAELLASCTAGRPDTPSEAAVIDRINNPLDCLVICNMGPEVGFSLYTSRAIRAETVLFLYAGELAEPVSYSPERNSDYAWLPPTADGPEKVINAANVGGLARFMQHLPIDCAKHKAMLESQLNQHIAQNSAYSAIMRAKNITVSGFVDDLLKGHKKDDEVGKLHFHDKRLKEGLMSSNVKLCTVVIRGIPVVAVVAEEDLEANTQVGFSYGKQYWLTAQQQPRYFYDDGSLVPLSAYRNAFYPALNRSQPLLSGIVQPEQPTPKQLYDQALALYKTENKKSEKDFSLAINTLKLSIAAYRQQDAKEEEVATCYSTLAAFYRDNDEISQAIEACQIALTMREKLVETNESIRPLMEKTQIKLTDLKQSLQITNGL